MLEDMDFTAEFDEFSVEDLEEVDAFIECLKEMPRSEVLILNPHRVNQMRFSCAAIKKAMREHNRRAKFVCKQSDIESSMGYVDVEAEDIGIEDTEWFARAAEFASNTEIYPLKANKIRMTFTFHGLLTPLR